MWPDPKYTLAVRSAAHAVFLHMQARRHPALGSHVVTEKPGGVVPFPQHYVSDYNYQLSCETYKRTVQVYFENDENECPKVIDIRVFNSNNSTFTSVEHDPVILRETTDILIACGERYSSEEETAQQACIDLICHFRTPHLASVPIEL